MLNCQRTKRAIISRCMILVLFDILIIDIWGKTTCTLSYILSLNNANNILKNS